MIEQDCPFDCPHCGDAMSARVDATGGKHQSFITDHSPKNDCIGWSDFGVRQGERTLA